MGNFDDLGLLFSLSVFFAKYNELIGEAPVAVVWLAFATIGLVIFFIFFVWIAVVYLREIILTKPLNTRSVAVTRNSIIEKSNEAVASPDTRVVLQGDLEISLYKYNKSGDGMILFFSLDQSCSESVMLRIIKMLFIHKNFKKTR